MKPGREGGREGGRTRNERGTFPGGRNSRELWYLVDIVVVVAFPLY